MNITVRAKRLHDNAKLPQRSSAFAAGADLFCAEQCTIAPGQRHLISTGLAVEIPAGYYGRVAPRSGLAVRSGIDVMAGVIDADYRGELRVLAINLGAAEVKFEVGDRIAQLIIESVPPASFEWSEELDDTERGEGGFGSTGT